MATMVMAPSLAKKAGNTSIAGAKRAYSNRESRMNECSNDMLSIAEGRVYSMKSICHGYR